MSFDSLSEELLNEIAQLCAFTSLEDEFYAEYSGFCPPSPNLIWCKYWRLSALASINHRMRRICLPVLFSDIVLRCKITELDSTLGEVLEVLLRIIARRPHIARVIDYIEGYVPRNGWHAWLDSRREPIPHEVDLLCEILRLLPCLSSLCRLGIWANEEFVCAINAHPSFMICELLSFPLFLSHDIAAEMRANFLDKMCLSTVSCDDNGAHMVMDECEDVESDLNDWLEMGVKIMTLELRHSFILRLHPSHVMRICVDVSALGGGARYYAATLLEGHASSDMQAIEFRNVSHQNPTLPFQPDFRGTALELKSYVIRISPNACITENHTSAVWEWEWEVVEATALWGANRDGQISAFVASRTPALRVLNITGEAPNTPEFCNLQIEDVAAALGTLPLLRRLVVPHRPSQLVTDEDRNFGLPQSELEAIASRRLINNFYSVIRKQAPLLEKVELKAVHVRNPTTD